MADIIVRIIDCVINLLDILYSRNLMRLSVLDRNLGNCSMLLLFLIVQIEFLLVSVLRLAAFNNDFLFLPSFINLILLQT